MHKKYDHKTVEKKWQDKWKQDGLYSVGDRNTEKEKEYVLVEWPYPSGDLHIGHWYAFAVPDIYVRAHRMQGKQVLYPMGFDAFGLPAENAAIKRDTDPRTWTESNIAYMRTQLDQMGNAFSWDKTANSTDPEYFRWTQWMFTKFFERDIAYRGTGTVNWCPSCNTVLANEQVQSDGTCERCDTEVEKKEMEEWKLRITKYADRLIDDLDDLAWPEHIKEAQRRWIGRSEGAKIPFTLSTGDTFTVFTTRPDTLFGATYMVLAPEHGLVDKNRDSIRNWTEVATYIKETAKKDEIARTAEGREKTGIQLEGITATNPANGEAIPVYIADYVLAHYGTGAIMAVPAHDQRDFDFAAKYNIPVRQVIVTCSDDANNPPKEAFDEVKRDTVIVHVRDKSTGKYALLNWHGTLEGITTAIMGGIEVGQTPEDAARAEINEEAALPNVRIVKRMQWITAAKYCASHKKQNRCAHSYAFLAEVDNTDEQGVIAEEERQMHTLTWVNEDEVLERLIPDHQKQIWQLLNEEQALIGSGYLINSGEYDGMDSEDAKRVITEKVGGTLTNTYRLRDWSIGRQRYWGVPIPIVYDPTGKPHTIPEEHLPWLLPTDVDFKPTGEPPLAKSNELKMRVTDIFGEGWMPEVETMDTFVDSSWYYLRYLDPQNDTALASIEEQSKWMPIDIYFGGPEHTTMHLLYSRFWHKALFDIGLVTTSEPYRKRINRGLVLGPDGNKMSKSKGNVINPDEHVKTVGSDTVKSYLAFMGPYGELSNYPWDMGGIAGLRRFLERVYGLPLHVTESDPEAMLKLLHKTIEKVTRDIELYKFNTAISAMMIFVNEAEKLTLSKQSLKTFLTLLAPFAPHLTEELWHELGETTSIHAESWPSSDPKLAKEETVTIGVQINGKLRGEITLSPDAPKEVALTVTKENTALAARLEGGVTKVIYVPGKILNIIVKS